MTGDIFIGKKKRELEPTFTGRAKSKENHKVTERRKSHGCCHRRQEVRVSGKMETGESKCGQEEEGQGQVEQLAVSRSPR